MQRLIIILLLGITCLQDSQAQESHYDYDTYLVALHLSQHCTAKELARDSVNFSLDARWLKMTDKFLKKIHNSSDTEPLHIAETDKIGIIVKFNRKEYLKDWLALPEISRLISQHQLESEYEVHPYYNTIDSTTITLSSNRQLDWYTMVATLSNNFRKNQRHHDIFVRVDEETPFIQYYTPQPCADRCFDHFLRYDKGVISYGFDARSEHYNAQGSSWTVEYDTKSGIIKQITKHQED